MTKATRHTFFASTAVLALALAPPDAVRAAAPLLASVDATTMRHKVMCGYQGWFRCPGDAAGLGWVHWSRVRFGDSTVTTRTTA